MINTARLAQWLSLQSAVDEHMENARAAIDALDGRDTLVNRHLLRIINREHALSDLAFHLSESKAFDYFGEE